MSVYPSEIELQLELKIGLQREFKRELESLREGFRERALGAINHKGWLVLESRFNTKPFYLDMLLKLKESKILLYLAR